MSPTSERLDIDARWIYRRSFLLFFIAFELLAWLRVRRLPARVRGPRWMIFLLAPWATLRSLLLAVVAAAIFAVVVVVVVRVIVRPLLRVWLSPPADLSWGLFHLTAAETIVASAPARRVLGWHSKPGSLALTNRRLWFFPANGHDEPWFLRLEDVDRVVAKRPVFAASSPIRNWPEQLHVTSHSGPEAIFATAVPSVVLEWFPLKSNREGAALVGTGASPSPGAFE